jgi:hypothetical protein
VVTNPNLFTAFVTHRKLQMVRHAKAVTPPTLLLYLIQPTHLTHAFTTFKVRKLVSAQPLINPPIA